MKSLIVYGPQGCGKTTHAEELMKRHGLTSVVEVENTPVGKLKFVGEGVLYLTSKVEMASEVKNGQAFGLRAMSYETAMRVTTASGKVVFEGTPPRSTGLHPAFAAPFGNGVRPKTLDQLFTASGQTLDDVAAEATRRKPGESDTAFRSRIQRAVQAADYSKMAAHWDPATGKDRTVDTNKFFAEQYMVEPRTTRAQVIHQLLNSSTNVSREFLEGLSDEELLECARGPGAIEHWLLRSFRHQVENKND